MKLTKQQLWTGAGVVLGLYLITGLFDDSSWMPQNFGGAQHQYGPANESPISGYDTTGVEVFNNPEATNWRDMIFIAD